MVAGVTRSTREPGAPTAYQMLRGETEPISVGGPNQQAPAFRPPPDPTTALLMAVERLAPVLADAAGSVLFLHPDPGCGDKPEPEPEADSRP